jgi:hypothetical protein
VSLDLIKHVNDFSKDFSFLATSDTPIIFFKAASVGRLMLSILIEDWGKYMVYTCGSASQSPDVKPLVGNSTA